MKTSVPNLVPPGVQLPVSSYVRRAEELSLLASEAEGWQARAPALAAWGDAARHAGRIAESEEAFRALQAEAVAASDARALVIARIGLANVHCARSNWDEAIYRARADRRGERRRGRPAPDRAGALRARLGVFQPR